MAKKVTMYTLADMLGVTVTAVSRAFTPGSRIKEEKRQRILEKARELGYEPNESAARLSRPSLHIGLLLHSDFPAYSRELEAGFYRARRELSAYKADCELYRQDFGSETDLLERLSAIKDTCDALLYSGHVTPAIKDALRQLSEEGVLLALLGSDIPDVPRAFVSANDTAMTGHMAAQLMAFLLPSGTRRVAVLSRGLTAEQQQLLVGSFCRHALEEGLSVLPPIDTACYDGGTTAAVAALQQNGLRPDGIYVSSADCLPVCEWVARQPGLPLITSDLFEEMIPYLKSGVIKASLYQDPAAQTHAGLWGLYQRLARRETVPERLYARPQIILKSNLSLFETEGE